MTTYVRRCCTIVLAILLVFGINPSILAMADVEYSSLSEPSVFKQDAETYSYEGVSMPKDFFSDYFSGVPQKRSNKSLAENSALTQMSISDIKLQDDTLSMCICLPKDSGIQKLCLSGKLRQSYKTENGINSIIFEPEDTKEYAVLLCEIYNDCKGGKLLLESSKQHGWDSQPHLKMYIADRTGMVFLYEGVLPNILKSLNARDYPMANCYKDIYWAWDYVKHEMKRIPTDTMNNSSEMIAPQRALGSYSIRSYKETFYDSFYIAMDLYEIWSLPYIEFKHTNVTTADGTWIAAFRVAEHVEINGTTIDSAINPFVYKNVQIAFACGDNTTFTRVFQTGFVEDSSGGNTGGSITLKLLQHAVSQLPGGSTFLSVLSAISSMTSGNKTVNLGNNSITLFSGFRNAVGEKLSAHCIRNNFAETNAHYFIFQAVTQYEAVNATTSTVGALKVTFDMEFNDYYETCDPFQYQLDYSVHP